MLYQLLLCLMQTIVTLVILGIAGVNIPVQGVMTPWGILDVGLTILITTYSADMMALMVSCIVKTTTTAMTVMPFLLIFQLVFSGGFFQLSGIADKIKYATISHWGMDGLCSIGRYNELPMVTLWNTLVDFKDVEILGKRPLQEILADMERSGIREHILNWSGSFNANPAYESTVANVATYWGGILILLVIFAAASVIALKFVDRDKR